MTAWHIATDCEACGKFVTDEDDNAELYHTTCYKLVRKKKK